jgi:PIN domain nuclease of toxin-antitoxin system
MTIPWARFDGEVGYTLGRICRRTASIWEVCMKQAIGKLQVSEDFQTVLEEQGSTLSTSRQATRMHLKSCRCITAIPSIAC